MKKRSYLAAAKKMGKELGFYTKLLLVFALLVTVFLTVKKMPAANLFLELGNPSESISAAFLTLDGKDADTFYRNQSYQLYVERTSYKAEQILLKVQGELKDDSCTLKLISGKKSLGTVTLSAQSGDVFSQDGDFLVITWGEASVREFQRLTKDDPALKREILIPLWLIALALLLYDALKGNRDRKKRITAGIAAAGICVLMLWVILTAVPKAQKSTSFHITTKDPSPLLISDTTITQTFYSEEDIYGVTLKFATWQNAPKGKYCVDISEAATGNVVSENVLQGKNIVDNGWNHVLFEQKLPGGKEYRITIYQDPDSETNADTLSVWINGNDLYPDGEMQVNGTETGADCCFELLVEGPNLYAWIWGVLIITAGLCALCLFGGRLKTTKQKTVAVLLVYAILLISFLAKMSFIRQYTQLDLFDEMAHISCLADISDDGLIPDYENMRLMIPYTDEPIDPETVYLTSGAVPTEGIFDGRRTGTVNYLGHPPLYYWVMNLFHPVTEDGSHIYVNMTLLRNLNMALAVITCILAFYIGYTRIRKEPSLHLLYGAICIALPMLSYGAVTVNNDNLTNLTVLVFLLGAIRFTEGRKNYLTYLLLAAGLSATILTKLTAGVMLGLTAVIFVIIRCIREKNGGILFNRYMLASLPLYLGILGYLAAIYLKYHTIQPTLHCFVSDEVFRQYSGFYVPMTIRGQKGVWDVVMNFFKGFFMQWENGIPWIETGVSTAAMYISAGVFLVLWIFPFLYLKKIKDRDMKNELFSAFAWSVIFTIGLQLVRGVKDYYYVSGHMGTQSRYYVCLLPILALMAVKAFEDRKKNAAIPTALLVGWMSYGGFLFYLLNMKHYY